VINGRCHVLARVARAIPTAQRRRCRRQARNVPQLTRARPGRSVAWIRAGKQSACFGGPSCGSKKDQHSSGHFPGRSGRAFWTALYSTARHNVALQPTRRAERAAAQADIAGGGTGTFQQDEIPNLSAKMTIMSTDDLVAEALRLPRRERARVAEELLSSLEEPADEVAAAWATELERRSQDVAEGRVQTVAWETARMEILKDLEERRASRSPS